MCLSTLIILQLMYTCVMPRSELESSNASESSIGEGCYTHKYRSMSVKPSHLSRITCIVSNDLLSYTSRDVKPAASHKSSNVVRASLALSEWSKSSSITRSCSRPSKVPDCKLADNSFKMDVVVNRLFRTLPVRFASKLHGLSIRISTLRSWYEIDYHFIGRLLSWNRHTDWGRSIAVDTEL